MDAQDIQLLAQALYNQRGLAYIVNQDKILLTGSEKFRSAFNIGTLYDYEHSPYDKIAKVFGFTEKEKNAFELEDTRALLSGERQGCQLELKTTVSNLKAHYLCDRYPIKDSSGRVCGLSVVIMEIIKNEEAPPKQEQESAANSIDHKPCVLLIDKDMKNRNLIKSDFEALGCIVDCTDSEDAISMFVPGKYDLIGTDLKLFGTSGYALSRKFREMEKSTKTHTPIIVFTTSKPEVVSVDCKEYEMDAIVSKPVKGGQVKQIFEHYIQHKKANLDGIKTLN